MPVSNLLTRNLCTSCSVLNYGVDSPYHVWDTSYCDNASCCVKVGA